MERTSFASALKAAGLATVMVLLFLGSLYTPVGVLLYLVTDGFIFGILRSLGWMRLDAPESETLFALYVAFGLMAIAVWLFSFRLSFTLFKASAERKARIREQEEYE